MSLRSSQYFVRGTLSVVVVVVSLMMLFPILAFKVLEGAYLACSFTKDWLQQVWRETPTRVGKRDQDGVSRPPVR